jgi:ribosomal-protein-alanine N-acetyltransferase
MTAGDTGFVIRKAQPSDLQEVMEINRQELPENYSPDFFRDMLFEQGDYFFVATGGDRILGYVMCRKETDFSPFRDHFSLSPRGHVVSLAVRSSNRRAGIGRHLMEAAHDAMMRNGIKESYLEVRVDNAAAISLYKNMGYEIRRTVSSYYMDGTDAHVMVLRLQ